MSVPKREIPSEVIDAALRRWAAAGETNYIPVTGHSMRPLLQDGDTVQIAHGVADIGRGDIIVFRQNGGLVVHRVVRIDDSVTPTVFVTKGDNVRHHDAPVSADNVLGRVLTVVRNDQEVAVDTRGWRVFGLFLAITSLLWAIPFSRLRQWKRQQVGSRFYRPIQAISKLYLLSTNVVVKSAEFVLNRGQTRSRLSAEERLLCLCTRQQLSAEHEHALRDLVHTRTIDWDSVFDTAKLHGVAPLVGHNLTQATGKLDFALPPHIDKRFKMVKMRNTVAKRKRIDAVTAALPLFAAGHVAVMPVKGAALDLLVYDQFWYMTSDDLDLVFDVSDEGAFSAEISAVLPDLVAVKVEYDFYSHHDVTMNDTLPVDFDTIWRDAYIGDWHGEPVHLMTWEDMLIAVCINSCRKRFFRLKALCDVAETVARGDMLDWTLFLQKVGDYDCGAIVYAALAAADLTVGHTVPEWVVVGLPISRARRRLIDRLARRMSLQAFDSIFEGRVVFGRNLDPSLMLQYATLQSDQLRRKAGFVWQTRERQTIKQIDD